MDGTTEFDALFKYFSHIKVTEGHYLRTIFKGSGLQCEEFRHERDSNPAPLSKGKKEFSLKLKQYDERFHNYDQGNWCGSGQKAWGW